MIIKLGILVVAVLVHIPIALSSSNSPPLPLLEQLLKSHHATNVAVTLPPSLPPTPVVVSQPTSEVSQSSLIQTYPPAPSILPTNDDLYAEWTKVAICEEGSWSNYAEGPNFYGSLGISAAAWSEYGSQFDRTNATPEQQIEVGTAIVGSNVPDQSGCASW